MPEAVRVHEPVSVSVPEAEKTLPTAQFCAPLQLAEMVDGAEYVVQVGHVSVRVDEFHDNGEDAVSAFVLSATHAAPS
jgi:hypothetical protein